MLYVENSFSTEYHCSMAPRLKSSGIGTKISIPLIAAAVIIVAAIQYSWFSRSAEIEIEGAERSIQAIVWQAIAREFQRYAPLVGDLRELFRREQIDLFDLKEFLEREYMIYGPSGTSPRLIESVYILTDSEKTPSYVFNPASGGWEIGRERLPLPEQKRRTDGNGTYIDFIELGSSPNTTKGFLIASRNGTRSTVAVGIDSSGFFEVYLKPAIAGVLPGAEIQWTNNHDPANTAPSIFETRRPAFNPLSALVGLSSARSRTFLVPVSIGFGSFYRAEPGRERGSLAPVFANDRSFIPDNPAQKSIPGMRMALVTLSSSSALGSIERRLALNWLLGTGLVIGLGTALAMSVLQKRRLALTRQKEREFVASVTHELRTPVTAIRSAADNIRRGIVSGDRILSYGEMIHNEALRLGSMVEEVILSSRVEERSPAPPSLAPIETRQFLDSLRSTLETIAKAEGVRLSWDFGALPQRFMGEAETIRLILSNLVTNSIYHAYSGNEKGDVRIVGRTSLPSSIRFIVEDDGRGIAKNEAEQVFEAFYRDETSRLRNEKGSGLGLFIARRKAHELGGELGFESPYRRIDGSRRPGCRFVLELPLIEVDENAG